jgi:hypothetical protein
MAKIRVKVKAGSKGKPLGKYIAEYRKGEADQGKVLYKPKARLTTHINYGK